MRTRVTVVVLCVCLSVCPGTIYYLSDGLEMRAPPRYKVHINFPFLPSSLNIASGKKLESLLGNTNGMSNLVYSLGAQDSQEICRLAVLHPSYI